MEREYIYNGQRIFVLSSDGDDYDGFARAREVIEKKIRPDGINIKLSYFDWARCTFIKSGLTVEMEYSNWFGVELKIDEHANSQQLAQVMKWIKLIEKT